MRDFESYQIEALKRHNYLRSLHGVQEEFVILGKWILLFKKFEIFQLFELFQPLELDENLCESANAWASVNAREEKMYHSSEYEYHKKYVKKYGENLAYRGTQIPGAPEITNLMKFG